MTIPIKQQLQRLGAIVVASFALVGCGGGGGGTSSDNNNTNISPGTLSIAKTLQPSVKVMPVDTSNWNASETLAATDLQDEFVNKWQVVGDPGVTAGQVFLLKSMAYKVDTIDDLGNNTYAISTSVPKLEEVFSSLKMEGAISLAGGDPANTSTQVGVLSDATDAITFTCDASSLKCTAPTMVEGDSSIDVSAGKASDLVYAGSPVNRAWGITVNYKNTSLKNLYKKDWANLKKFTASSENASTNVDILMNGTVGIYGDVVFEQGFDAANVSAAQNLRFDGYMRVNNVLKLLGNFTATGNSRLFYIKKTVAVPVSGVPVPLTFFFPIDLLTQASIQADGSFTTNYVAKISLRPAQADSASFNSPSPQVVADGSVLGSLSSQMRMGMGMGIAGLVPATVGIKGGLQADFTGTASAGNADAPSCSGNLSLSPLLGADFITENSIYRSNGLGNARYELLNKKFAPIFNKTGQCSPAPTVKLRQFYTGPGGIKQEYAMGQRVPGNGSTLGASLQLDASQSSVSMGAALSAVQWRLYRAGSGFAYYNQTGTTIGLTGVDWQNGDEVEATVTQTSTSGAQSSTVRIPLKANANPMPVASFVYWPQEQRAYLNVEGSNDPDGTLQRVDWTLLQSGIKQASFTSSKLATQSVLVPTTSSSTSITANVKFYDNDSGTAQLVDLPEAGIVSAIVASPSQPAVGSSFVLTITGRQLGSDLNQVLSVVLSSGSNNLYCNLGSQSFTQATATCTATASGSYTVNVVRGTGSLQKTNTVTTVAVGPGIIVTTSKLPHTGITANQCYQAGSDTLVSCSSVGALALSGAGKQDGMYANVNPMSYSPVGNYPITSCIKDNVTGLMWEGKEFNGTRAGSNSYTNYDSTSSAQKWNGSTLVSPTQTDINASTNSVGYVNYVNSTALCGYTNWRLPTVDELETLVDADPSSNIHSIWFPNTGGVHWSSSPYVGYSYGAWVVNFDYGYVDYHYFRSSNDAVRLVRASQ